MVVNTDPSSQQHAIVVTAIVCPIISGLFVLIRMWTRTLITRTVGWNDCEFLLLLLLLRETPPMFFRSHPPFFFFAKGVVDDEKKPILICVV